MKRQPWPRMRPKAKKPPTMAEAAAAGTTFVLEVQFVADIITIRNHGLAAWATEMHPAAPIAAALSTPASYRTQAQKNAMKSDALRRGRWGERVCAGTTTEQLLGWVREDEREFVAVAVERLAAAIEGRA